MSTPSSNAKITQGVSIVKTFKARSADAIRHLRDALHLSQEMDDADVLTTALAEIVIEASSYRPDPRFAEAVRQRYRELSTLLPAPKPTMKKNQALSPLVPLKRAEGEYDSRVHVDPWAPPDPASIIRVYGKDQLGRALQDYMLDSLKQTAAKIEREHPGTKPTNRGRKDAVIEYIVKYAGQ